MERIKNGRVKTPDQYNWHYEDNGLVIDESFFAPTRLRVLQLAITWSAAPTVSNSFTVYKNSVWGNPYNVLLYSVDPSTGALNLTDDVCVQSDGRRMRYPVDFRTGGHGAIFLPEPRTGGGIV